MKDTTVTHSHIQICVVCFDICIIFGVFSSIDLTCFENNSVEFWKVMTLTFYFCAVVSQNEQFVLSRWSFDDYFVYLLLIEYKWLLLLLLFQSIRFKKNYVLVETFQFLTTASNPTASNSCLLCVSLVSAGQQRVLLWRNFIKDLDAKSCCPMETHAL